MKQRLTKSNLSSVIFLCIVVFVLGIMLYRVGSMIFNVISVSTQYSILPELRDYVGIRVTDTIMHGINPYTLENVSDMSIPLLYLYTPVNAALVAFLCTMTGCSILVGNYILNLYFIFLTAVFLYLILKEYISTRPIFHILLFLFLFLSSTTFFSMFGEFAFTFRSDSLGILIYCFILYLVYKNKKETFLISFLSVFLLLTKQNMILLAVPVFFYFLIMKWQKALKYFFQCALIMVALLITVYLFFPLLWTESIFVQFLSVDTSSLVEAILNIMVCIKRYFVFALIDSIFVIAEIVMIVKQKKKVLSVCRDKNTSYSFYLVLNVLVALLSLLYFAQNGADGFKYCQEMLAIPVFLLGMLIIFKYKENILHYIKLKRFLSSTAFAFFLCMTAVLFSTIQFKVVKYSNTDIVQYKELYSFLDQYDVEDIFVDKSGTGYFLQNNIVGEEERYYDDGHITYFMSLQDTSESISKIFQSNKLKTLALSYRNRMLEKVENTEFEALVVNDFFSEALLSEHYLLVEELQLKNICNDVQTVQLYIKRQ